MGATSDRLSNESGINVKVKLDNDIPVLPREIQLTLFRTAQETLGNIRRHSKATKACLKLEQINFGIRLSISDNGVGFIVPANLTEISGGGKIGLLGMQERVMLAKGSSTLTSKLNKGTTVAVDILYNH